MTNDPYTAKASDDASLKEKVDELREQVTKSAKFAMLTTRSKDGSLHARAMSPASDKGLAYTFIGNNESHKFDDLDHDDNVNISFSDASSTNWASIAGKARVLSSPEEVKEFWNPAIKAWFGDLGGEKDGSYKDPRVSAIEVIPSEIRYWVKTRTSIGQAFEVAKGAVTGETAAPGHLRTIAGEELKLARSHEGKTI